MASSAGSRYVAYSCFTASACSSPCFRWCATSPHLPPSCTSLLPPSSTTLTSNVRRSSVGSPGASSGSLSAPATPRKPPSAALNSSCSAVTGPQMDQLMLGAAPPLLGRCLPADPGPYRRSCLSRAASLLLYAPSVCHALVVRWVCFLLPPIDIEMASRSGNTCPTNPCIAVPDGSSGMLHAELCLVAAAMRSAWLRLPKSKTLEGLACPLLVSYRAARPDAWYASLMFVVVPFLLGESNQGPVGPFHGAGFTSSAE